MSFFNWTAQINGCLPPSTKHYRTSPTLPSHQPSRRRTACSVVPTYMRWESASLATHHPSQLPPIVRPPPLLRPSRSRPSRFWFNHIIRRPASPRRRHRPTAPASVRPCAPSPPSTRRHRPPNVPNRITITTINTSRCIRTPWPWWIGATTARTLPTRLATRSERWSRYMGLLRVFCSIHFQYIYALSNVSRLIVDCFSLFMFVT